MSPAEQVILVVAGVSSCVNTVLQIIRSRERRRESEERRKEISERKALATWLYDHGTREEEKSDKILGVLETKP